MSPAQALLQRRLVALGHAAAVPRHQSLRADRKRCTCRAAVQDDEDLDWESYFDSDDLGLPTDGNAQTKPKLYVRGQCYGCGVSLQCDDDEAAGYVDPEKYAPAARFRTLNALLCSRCVQLTHGQMVPAVEDFTQKRQLSGQAASTSETDADRSARRPLLTPEQLREQIKVVRSTKALCVMLVDVLDASGTVLAKVRDLIGANPLVVVATKCDLLPKGTDPANLERWLQDFVAFKGLQTIGVYLISSKTGDGVSRAIGGILSQRNGRDIYVVGAANVGKTAFVRAMTTEMKSMASRHFDPAAAAVSRRLPVESTMPGTTLGLVRLGAFSSGGDLYDTPGLHLHHRIPHMLRPDELRVIHPHRRLRSLMPMSPRLLAEQHGVADATGHVWPCGTYHWSALLRIDVVEATPDMYLVFFGTGALQVHPMPLLDEDELLEHDPDMDPELQDEVLFASQSAVARGGLRLARTDEVNTVGFRTTLADIAVSGMPGWVAIVGGATKGVIKLRIWTPKGVEAYLRPPLPSPTPIYMD